MKRYGQMRFFNYIFNKSFFKKGKFMLVNIKGRELDNSRKCFEQ